MAGMTQDRFEELISLHGSDLRAWPRNELVQATALLESSFEANQLLEAARESDRMLSTLTTPVASDELRSAILGDAHRVLSETAVATERKQAERISQRDSIWHRAKMAFTGLFSPWAPQVAIALVVALFGGIVSGAIVSDGTVDQETLVAAYGADVDYWMVELNPELVQADGGET